MTKNDPTCHKRACCETAFDKEVLRQENELLRAVASALLGCAMDSHEADPYICKDPMTIDCVKTWLAHRDGRRNED